MKDTLGLVRPVLGGVERAGHGPAALRLPDRVRGASDGLEVHTDIGARQRGAPNPHRTDMSVDVCDQRVERPADLRYRARLRVELIDARLFCG